ncbi:helix-turn-helix domain-containing protein [Streptomyces sp. NPDC055722]
MAHSEALSPTDTVAKRVREVRKRRGLTAEQLADKLREQGILWDRYTVTKLENGKRQNITLTEWLALAVVLNVSPLHLLVPPWPSPKWERPEGERNDPNDEAGLLVTPKRAEPMYLLRRYIRGSEALPGMDERKFFSEIPPQEFSPLLERERDGEGV